MDEDCNLFSVEFLEETDNMITPQTTITGSKWPKVRKRTKSNDCDEIKLKLAKIIKNYGCLWDKQNEMYRNKQKREEAWTEIATELLVTGKHFHIFFKSYFRLCSCFLKLLK